MLPGGLRTVRREWLWHHPRHGRVELLLLLFHPSKGRGGQTPMTLSFNTCTRTRTHRPITSNLILMFNEPNYVIFYSPHNLPLSVLSRSKHAQNGIFLLYKVASFNSSVGHPPTSVRTDPRLLKQRSAYE